MKIVGKAGGPIKQPAKKLTTAAARFVRLFRFPRPLSRPPCFPLGRAQKSGENNVGKNERMKEAAKAKRQ